ncbi:9-O-acetylesterase [Bacteroidia bacterium]|nr:9-O-acetylesterase [Bacteroidia bacterium]
MVLQQQSETPVWGESNAQQKITITTSWNNQSCTAMADEQGKWKTTIATPEAGGPYSILISSGKKDKIELKNVLIGEVWICSGQSNMEMRVRESADFANEKAKSAHFPQVRMLTVEKATATLPVTGFQSQGWQVSSPETVGEFSAAGYFFGCKLNQDLKVPVGLINTSWGGTIAEAWTSGESLEQMPYFTENVKTIRQVPNDRDEQDKLFARQWNGWLDNLKKLDPGLKDPANEWIAKDLNTSGWQNFTLPGIVQEQKLTLQNGIFWFRKEIEIPKSWEGKELKLSMGVIDDYDFTYFNGVEVGSTDGWFAQRNYKVPASLVKAGKATISVRVLDTGGLGGFYQEDKDYFLEAPTGEKINLSGTWKFHMGLPLSAFPAVPKPINNEPNHVTVLYNAMIYPLLSYKIKGAIWYQGESNSGRACQYRELLPLMITDWRKHFGYDFPFYIVQLANYTALQTEPVESTWAELREAQYMTTHLKNTGIANIIDVGEADDIHPKNKQEVGRRLALSALAQTYNKNVVYSGPVYDGYRIEGNQIRLFFKHTDGGLKTRNGEDPKGFTIAGLDHQFRWAEARIAGNEIVVSHPDIAFPVAVRYAWADNPVCNLYNGAGLPAFSFRTDDWPGVTSGNQ